MTEWVMSPLCAAQINTWRPSKNDKCLSSTTLQNQVMISDKGVALQDYKKKSILLHSLHAMASFHTQQPADLSLRKNFCVSTSYVLTHSLRKCSVHYLGLCSLLRWAAPVLRLRGIFLDSQLFSVKTMCAVPLCSHVAASHLPVFHSSLRRRLCKCPHILSSLGYYVPWNHCVSQT